MTLGAGLCRGLFLLLLASLPTACKEWEFYFVISFMRDKVLLAGR